MYRFFDLSIESELALPGLPACADPVPAWSIAKSAGEIDHNGLEWYHTWKDPDGRQVGYGITTLACTPGPGTYVLRLTADDSHRLEDCDA